VDDLSSADPLLNPDDLFEVPHGMDVDDLATNFFVPDHAIEAAIHAVNDAPVPPDYHPDDDEDVEVMYSDFSDDPVASPTGPRIPPEPPPAPRLPRLDDPDDRLLFINHLNRDALRILWHQRLGHLHHRRVSEMHKHAIGVPELPLASAADQCPTCMAAKMRKSARGQDDSRRATQCYQGVSIDFGFVIQASANTSRYRSNVGFHGETCYVIISDHFSGLRFGKAFKSKAPPRSNTSTAGYLLSAPTATTNTSILTRVVNSVNSKPSMTSSSVMPMTSS